MIIQIMNNPFEIKFHLAYTILLYVNKMIRYAFIFIKTNGSSENSHFTSNGPS